MAAIDFKAILESILDAYHSGTSGSEVLSGIAEKIEAGKATYAEVYRAALEHGKLLTGSLRRFLPDALEAAAENLSPELADAIIRPSMVAGAKDLGKLASQVQTALNRKADLGIGFIEPKPNMDQISGIISGLCQAESYESGEPAFLNRVGNYLEGYVDDCVRENANFQYQAGLSPTIERRAVANCCKWCSALAGVYAYDKVSDTGNDVFRRHRNCHCQVLFSPDGSKRRQDVHSKRWITENATIVQDRQMRFGEKERFIREKKIINARELRDFKENNLYMDENATLSKKEVRRINGQITQAKEKHGVNGICNSPIVITKDPGGDWNASYIPELDVFFVNEKLGKKGVIQKAQFGYACAEDSRSTMVHEIFHWKDAKEYRQKNGSIDRNYTIYCRERAIEKLKLAGYGEDEERIRTEISSYAYSAIKLDNNFDEAYTELRTRNLLVGRDG